MFVETRFFGNDRMNLVEFAIKQVAGSSDPGQHNIVFFDTLFVWLPFPNLTEETF